MTTPSPRRRPDRIHLAGLIPLLLGGALMLIAPSGCRPAPPSEPEPSPPAGGHPLAEAATLLRTGDPLEALAYLEAAARRHPEVPRLAERADWLRARLETSLPIEEMEASLLRATNHEREGRLAEAITEIDAARERFPDNPIFATLHERLVARKDALDTAEALKIQNPWVVNRVELPAPERLAFALSLQRWNTAVKTGEDATVSAGQALEPDLQTLLQRFPNFVEGRLLQASVALMTGNPSAGRSAGDKLAAWRIETIIPTPEVAALVQALEDEGWLPDNPPPKPPAAFSPADASPVDRIRAALSSSHETAPATP